MASSDFKIDAKQLARLGSSMSKAGKDYRKAAKRFLKEIGNHIKGGAQDNAPESPLIRHYAKANKSGTTNRKRSSITSGALRNSITSDVGRDQVSIGVPANSPAGKYAEKIHDEKGKAGGWEERGPRTKEKGDQADEKYIYRAAEDSEKVIDELLDRVISHFTNEIGI